MNRTELVKTIASKAKMTFSDTERMINALITILSEVLQNGGVVTLTGFGKFSVAHRKAKTGVNPKTGAKIMIPGKAVPVFKADKALKCYVGIGPHC